MKIALICPSNKLYMPYVKNYEHILMEQKIDYDMMNWDRFHIEEESRNTYRDEKAGHQRGFFDYLKYKRFIIQRLNNQKYDKLIIFGIQLTYFLKETLLESFNGKFIVDIRDYNKILHFFDIGKIIEASDHIVLSSSGYKKWLPKSDKYVINHNTQITSMIEMVPAQAVFSKEKVSLTNIGATRDYKVNRKLLYKLKNKERFHLNYHGEGEINALLKRYLNENHISNASVTGRYTAEEEASFYENSDLINVFRLNDSINNRTALPNRLYKAALYGKPLVTLKGSYLAEQILTYQLGIVADTLENIDQLIIEYIRDFDLQVYRQGRIDFFSKVIEENTIFKNNVLTFLGRQ